MENSLEELFSELIGKWWNNFCSNYWMNQLDRKPIGTSTCYRFFALRCGLTRIETKILSRILRKLGVLQIKRKGWLILSDLNNPDVSLTHPFDKEANPIGSNK